MNLKLLAFLGAVLWIGAVVAMVAGLIGTRKPPGPKSALDRSLRAFWNGTGRSAKKRARHRALLIVAVIGGVLAWLLTGLPVIGILIAITIPGAPWVFNVGHEEREAIVRIEAVGEWARRLKDVSVVGMGLQQAIVASAATAPADIAEEVRDLAVRLQAGLDARAALMRFADDIADAVCDQVVAALTLHLSDRGDRLGDVLTSIANAAAAEVATRREVEAKRTQSRFAVKFLTVTTVLGIAFGLARPNYMKPYHTPLGELIMVVLASGFIGILLWVRSMSKPERAMRFLTTTVDAPMPMEVS
ncbi:MAG TPA: type II secretion system F family protein [Micromonosporaceae bacterium]|jgi:Flp pilus assembly protein TadB